MIDFGKFLGDHQMIGNFKRDRSPFVLTPDMAYVINGCEKKPSEKFHDFVDLCCKGNPELYRISSDYFFYTGNIPLTNKPNKP